MESFVVRLSALILTLVSLPILAAEPAVPIGAKIENLRFKDIRYLARSLSDFGEKKAYVLVFVDTACPLVAKYLPVLDRLERTYRDKGVQVVAVNCGSHDTIAAMADQAVEFGIEFPFVKDRDCATADALGVTRTPEVAILDGKRTLRYRGRIDDQYRPGGQRASPSRRDLVEALDEVLAGKEVTVATTPVDGCVVVRPGEVKDDRTVTYAEHVAPILAKHCQSCHRPNTAAPFALQTYEQTKARGRTIAEVVSEGRMPPWFAVPRNGDRVDHKSLSAAERETVVRWVKTGLARGDDSKLPKPVEARAEKWRIGEPDLVVTTTAYQIPAEGDIPYKYAVLAHHFSEDTWVQGVQILPEIPKSVHHANLAYYKIGESFKESNFITGVVPGGEPMTVGPGVAFKIPRGSVLGLQIHFVTSGKPETVRVSVGLKFAGGVIQKQLRHMLFVDTKYSIPPGAPAHPVKVTRTLDRDALGIGLFTHMHVRGKAMTYKAVYPDGTRETLLSIPNYNFEWQIPYRWMPNQKLLPKGTRIECTALYDNSPFNPYNPDPAMAVRDGPQTYHEMMNGFFFYIDKNEDLNLTIDPKTGRVSK